MIYFKCSICGEGLEAPESMRGEAAKCPSCGLHTEVQGDNVDLLKEGEPELQAALYTIRAEEESERKQILTNCPACQHQISKTAASCPSCGHPIRSKKVDSFVDKKWNPGVAAVLSFFIPGLGQLYKGQVANGLVWFICVAVGYGLLIIPGLIVHVCCIVGAASGNPYEKREMII